MTKDRSRLELVSVQAVPPDQERAIEALERALLECGLADASQRTACLNRLVVLPDSLALPRLRRLGLIGTPPSGFLDEIHDKLDEALGDSHHDIQTRALRIREGSPDEKARWRDLSRAEQMRATRLWRSIAASHPTDISVERKGRPAAIDSGLVLYLMFVLTEALGRPQFGYSTQAGEKRTGPMLRALMAALHVHRIAEQSVGGAPITRDPSADAVVTRIIKAARSNAFRVAAKSWLLELTADAVAASPSAFRLLVATIGGQRRRRTD